MDEHVIAQVQFILRLFFGLVFGYSAASKLGQLSVFAQGVVQYQVLPPAVAIVVGYVLPFIELGLALLLPFGIFPLFFSGFMLFLLFCFAVALTVNAARKRDISCHCFGSPANSRVGWHSLFRDLLLLPPAIWLFISTLRPASASVDLSTFTFPMVGIAAVVAMLYVLSVESLDVYISRPKMVKEVE